MKITITLKMSELIYDIQNKSYLTGRSLNNGSNHSHVANMQANDDEENVSQILRSITMAYSLLRNRLAEYMEGGGATASNTLLSAEDNIEISLEMPSNFNGNATQTLVDAAHQFIVATAIADWFAITAKGETADYTVMAEGSLRIIEESLCKRIRPSRN